MLRRWWQSDGRLRGGDGREGLRRFARRRSSLFGEVRARATRLPWLTFGGRINDRRLGFGRVGHYTASLCHAFRGLLTQVMRFGLDDG